MSLKNEKGSITIFVLVGLIFMTGFLIISYGRTINNSKIVKEQFNIISGIYMPNNNIEESYTEVYTDLRKKNIKNFSFEEEADADKTIFENTNTVELKRTFQGKISNYRIYGAFGGVGNKIIDEINQDSSKYVIPIRITDINTENIENNNEIYQEDNYEIILIGEPLNEGEYIDYSLKQIIRYDGTIEDINLPELSIFEDYTRIEILTENIPEKITVNYKGYTLE